MQKWEYLEITITYKKKGFSTQRNFYVYGGPFHEETEVVNRSEALNKLGDDGWELVSVEGNWIERSLCWEHIFYLKRPKE